MPIDTICKSFRNRFVYEVGNRHQDKIKYLVKNSERFWIHSFIVTYYCQCVVYLLP